MKIKENTKAPIFKLCGIKNKKFDLKKTKGKLILYFYPKDDTPGCTLETKDFSKLYKKFKKIKCEVIGISKDSIESHEKFKKKYKAKSVDRISQSGIWVGWWVHWGTICAPKGNMKVFECSVKRHKILRRDMIRFMSLSAYH